SLGASLVMLRLFFRKSIPGRYDVTALRRPAEAVADPTTFRAGIVVLAALLVGYFAADAIGVPVAAVASLCALALVLIAARRPRVLFRRVGTQIRVRPSGSHDDLTATSISRSEERRVGTEGRPRRSANSRDGARDATAEPRHLRHEET